MTGEPRAFDAVGMVETESPRRLALKNQADLNGKDPEEPWGDGGEGGARG